MKALHSSLLAIGLLSVSFFWSCQKSVNNDQLPKNINSAEGQAAAATACNPNAYVITLESVSPVDGKFEWVWSVRNPNPGNGTNGTVQDLSHWGMQFGSCFNASHVVSAAYSSNGSSWHSFNPTIQVDPSQGCMTAPVLKFDFGTSGGNKSYYKLVLNGSYQSGPVPGYYKSGRKTGCCTFQFTGVACGIISS